VNAPAPAAVTERQRFLGGSDAAAVLGVSPFATPVDVYLEKTGHSYPAPPDHGKERLFRWGKLLEPVVVKHLRQDYGVKVTKVSTPRKPNRYQDQEHGFLAAEIDFEWRVTRDLVDEYELSRDLVNTIQNGEIKTVHTFAAAKFGEAETEDVPIEYAAQAMAGLMVTGRKLCMFGVLTGTRDVTLYWIKRDEQTIAAMRARLVAFWHDHVLAGVPPHPLNVFDTYKLFRKAPSTKVEATPEVIALCHDLESAKDDQRIAAERELECKYEIGKYMLGASGIMLGSKGKLLPAPDAKPGQHLLHVGGAPLLTLELRSQSRLDGERLKSERPEVHAEFQKSSTHFVFSKPKRKRQ